MKEIVKEAKSIGQAWVDTQAEYELLDIADAVQDDGSFRELTNEDLKPFIMQSANNDFTEQIKALVLGVPEDEVLTWAKQETEAKAWQLDNSVDTPLIDGILLNRNKYSKVELVDKILEKAGVYAALTGQLIGLRQQVEDEEV